jgi:hypothetical protein
VFEQGEQGMLDVPPAPKGIEMTMTVMRAGLLAATLAALLTLTTGAQAQANCDWYGKTALKQQQENEQRKCGFTGPNWTSDLKAHMTWCAANPDQFRAEAQRRDQQLLTCKK